jgi:Leucine-rich repeat (LRR) protein
MKKWLLVLLVVLALAFFGDSNPEQERAKTFVNKHLGKDMSLQEIMKLKHLRLGHKQITDISPLNGLVKLKELFLRGNPISDKDIADLKVELPNCHFKQ